MIARVWKGAVRRADRDAYAEYMRRTGMPAYLEARGNRGAWMLRRDVDDATEFLMFTLWDSPEAVRAFAGDDVERAVFYPEDERFLVERDLQATHYEVVDGPGAARPETPASTGELPPLLAGRHVILRPMRVEDVERLAAIQAEPDVVRWWGPPDVAEMRRRAEGRNDEHALAIQTGNELVGLIEYYEEDEPEFRHAGMDLFLAERAQDRGLGPDAVRTLAEYLIHQRGHHRLIIDPAAANARAIRAFEKVGFRAVGVMRDYWRSPDGSWQDGLLMDLLAGEFHPR